MLRTKVLRFETLDRDGGGGAGVCACEFTGRPAPCSSERRDAARSRSRDGRAPRFTGRWPTSGVPGAQNIRGGLSLLLACCSWFVASFAQGAVPVKFFDKHCTGCHDAETKKGNLDLTALKPDFADAETFARWLKVHDRIESGEMPPKKKARPPKGETTAVTKWLRDSLVGAEKVRRTDGRATLLRLNRTEYENTLRDLLPEDERVQGYDKAGPALDFSTVQIAKYLDAASKALPLAIAPCPERDEAKTVRLYAGDDGGIMDGIINGDGVCLKDFKYDADVFPLSVPSGHVPGGSGFGFFEQLKKEGKVPYRGAIGFMRNGDDSQPDFGLMSPVVPGFYKVRVSMWGFRWDKGEVKATPPQVGRLMVNGRHSGSKEVVVGYYDAPSLKPTVSESVVWLNPGDSLKFQPISIEHDWQGIPRNKLAKYTGDGVAVDWLEVEGPLVEAWPGVGHRRLFGELPLVKFTSAQRPPRRPMGQWRGGPQPFVLTPKHQQAWTVASADTAADAEKLLASFLPLAFRRSVEREEVQAFAAVAQARLAEKATFEEAMLAAYQAALCSPEFLFLRETPGRLDDHALASRFSYFLWASMPDDELLALAAAKKLGNPKVLRAQTERMLADAKAGRFITDFTDQWLDLWLVDDNTPHSKLYPEFRAFTSIM